MKKLIVLAALGLGVPAVAVAGLHIPGRVIISANYMYGSFSVRFNPASPPGAYIWASNAASSRGGISNVTFYGTDGTASFFCYVPTTSPMFSAATDIKNAAGASNGTDLYVARDTATNECIYISSKHSSYFSD